MYGARRQDEAATPHVYGDVDGQRRGEVLSNWWRDQGGRKKAAGKTEPRGTLDGIPMALPALLRAQRLASGQPQSALIGLIWLACATSSAKSWLSSTRRSESGERAAIQHELGMCCSR